MKHTAEDDWSEYATGLGPVRPLELSDFRSLPDTTGKLRALLRTNLLYWRRRSDAVPATGMEVMADRLAGREVPV